MPGSMPYSLEKGPYLSVIEDYVNGSRESSARDAGEAPQRGRDRRARRVRLAATRRGAVQHRGAPRSLQAGLARLQAGRAGQMAAAPAVRRVDVTHHRVLAGVARRLRGGPAPHADPRARGEPRDPDTPRRPPRTPRSTGRSSCSGAAPSRGSRDGSRGGRRAVPDRRPGHRAPLDAQPRPPAQEHAVADQRRPRLRRGPTVRRRLPRLVGRQPAVPPAPQGGHVAAQPAGHRDVPDRWPRLQQRGNAGHREPGGVGGRRAEPTHTWVPHGY